MKSNRLLRVLLVDVLRQDVTLLGSALATDQGGVAIEVLGDFLEGSVLGLDVEEVDEGEFGAEPDALHVFISIEKQIILEVRTYIDDVVLPANLVECNRVDIGVEEQRQVHHDEHVAHTLGAEREGQDFYSVADEETGPGEIVASVVEEDHGDDGASVGLNLGGVVALGADCPNDEAQHHSAGGDEEERAATDLVDEEA